MTSLITPDPPIAMVHVYAAVFSTNGERWISVRHIRLTANDTLKAVNETRSRVPGWFRENRFVGVFAVLVTIEKEETR